MDVLPYGFKTHRHYVVSVSGLNAHTTLSCRARYTPVELQADMMRKQARREAEGQLTTRAWKERRGDDDGEEEGFGPVGGKKPVRIRVRMPDGAQLRGGGHLRSSRIP